MKLGLHSMISRSSVLDGTSVRCLEIENEEVFEVLSYGLARHFQSCWQD